VTEGHAEVDDKREQREPRTLSDMIPNPPHRQPKRFPTAIANATILSHRPYRSNDRHAARRRSRQLISMGTRIKSRDNGAATPLLR
jgi:hypothetical protein